MRSTRLRLPLSRLPARAHIADYNVTDFDSYTLKVTVNNHPEDKAVEGKRFEIRYNLKDNVSTPSPLQVLRARGH